ncbi:MAG: tetratricopeptide repeat protein [Bacteroidia bacterium]|nr:tetratricopeptide repeat protein [Bacteroidia bacterium]
MRTAPCSRLLAYALTASLALLAAAPLHAQGPGAKAYGEAEDLRKQNRNRDALEKYYEAVRLEPSNYKYYFQLAKCEYKLGQTDNAKESLKRTVDFRKNFTPAYSLLAKLYKDDKDYENAIFYYGEAARYETDPSRRVQYKLLLVNLLINEKRVDEARRQLEEAKAIDATNPNVLFYLGEITSEEEKWAEARQHYEAALASERLKDAEPAEKAKYYYGLGLALSKLGDAEGAKRAWSRANFGPYQALISQQMLETNHVYYYQVAVGYFLNGAYDEADQYAAKALEIQRNFSSALTLRARIAAKRGDLRAAESYYKQAIAEEKTPEKRGRLLVSLAGLQQGSNQPHEALSALSQAAREHPPLAQDPAVLGMKARTEYALARYNDAVQTLDALMPVTTDVKAKARYSFMLGMAARQIGNAEKAREAFKGALYGPYKQAAQVELQALDGK